MIIRVPRGEAPEEIRQAWLGLQLPCIGKFPSASAGSVLTGLPVDRGKNSYHVPQAQACAILKKSEPAAAAWWKSMGYPKSGKAFIFYEDEAIVIDQSHNPLAWG